MGVIALDDGAVATSGDYRHAIEIDGRRHAHTIDPRRGAPLENDLASVTVLAPTAMAADAWATALMVLGARRGAALARRLGVNAIFVTTRGELVFSHAAPLAGVTPHEAARQRDGAGFDLLQRPSATYR